MVTLYRPEFAHLVPPKKAITVSFFSWSTTKFELELFLMPLLLLGTSSSPLGVLLLACCCPCSSSSERSVALCA